MILRCRYSGILSAYGMALADVVHEAQKPMSCVYESGACFTISDDNKYSIATGSFFSYRTCFFQTRK